MNGAGGDGSEERADQSPMALKLRNWQKELKARLGEALKQLEPEGEDMVH